MKSLKLIFLAIGLISMISFLVQAGFTAPVQATTTIIDTNTDQTTPLIINHGDLLQINSGARLTMDSSLDNNGTINIMSGGTLWIDPNFIMTNHASGQINNMGEITANQANITNYGKFNDLGVLTLFFSDTFPDPTAGVPRFTNQAGAELYIDKDGVFAGVECDLTNSGKLNNAGFIHLFSCVLDNLGQFCNPGTIDGEGIIFRGNPIENTCISDTTTSIASNNNPSVFSQPVTLTATVTSSGGTPTGTVTFKDGITTIGSGTLDATGHATLSISVLSADTHNITAVYLGDSSFNTSSSPVLSQVVLTPAQAVNNLENLANSIAVKSSELDNAQKLLNDNNPSNDNGACGKLGAFINEVNANKSLTQDQKNLLIGQANVIKTAVGC